MSMTDQIEVVTVSPDDIAKSERNSPSKCGIAKHIKRAHKDLKRVKVGKETITAYSASLGVNLTWATPLSARKAIAKFDKGHQVEFPVFQLRYSEAEASLPYSSRIREDDPERDEKIEATLEANRRYTEAVRTGEWVPKLTQTQAQRDRFNRQRRAA